MHQPQFRENKPRLLIVDGLDKYFYTHRLPLAQAAQAAGFDVHVAALESDRAGKIREAGFQYIPLPISRRGTSVFSELQGVVFLRNLYKKVAPCLIHQITLKPVLYGSIAARFQHNIPVLNSITGLGYVFAAEDRARKTRAVIKMLSKVALAHPQSKTVFQNQDDQAEFVEMGLVEEGRTALIRGSGVDCDRFRATPLPSGRPIVMLATRMLWDKGVGDFVKLAKSLARHPADPRFVLVGSPDFNDARSIPVAQLEAWAADGSVEWWGYQEDMPAVLAQANIVVFPTAYREGVPKVLLEAAASARPLIATDMPGCREIVQHEINGLLVPPGDQDALSDATRQLLDSPAKRAQFGKAGSNLAMAHFSIETVVSKTLRLYQGLLEKNSVLIPA